MNDLVDNQTLPVAEDVPAGNSFQSRTAQESLEIHFDKPEKAVEQLQELHDNAKLCKYRHFAAAERKLIYHKICSWGAILIEIAIVVILLDVLVAHPELAWLKIIAVLGAAVAAALSASQHYFDFHKVSAGHRNIANRYLEVSKKCKRLQGRHDDLHLSPAELWNALEILDAEYDILNRDAEAFPTAGIDYKKALQEAKQSNELY